MEWNPALLELRGELEARFLGALRADVEPHADVGSALDSLLVEPVHGTGLSHFLRGEGQLWQLREYAALRSLYHLKEADPEVWAIPRLTGCAKAGLVAVEYDGYGAGRADRIHAKLFADLMADLGLDNRYGSYLESGTAAHGAPSRARSAWLACLIHCPTAVNRSFPAAVNAQTAIAIRHASG